MPKICLYRINIISFENYLQITDNKLITLIFRVLPK